MSSTLNDKILELISENIWAASNGRDGGIAEIEGREAAAKAIEILLLKDKIDLLNECKKESSPETVDAILEKEEEYTQQLKLLTNE